MQTVDAYDSIRAPASGSFSFCSNRIDGGRMIWLYPPSELREDSTMRIVNIQCATKGCGHSPFPMAASFIERAKRTHETFHCPAGHANFYPQESDEEVLKKKVKRLERNIRYLQDCNDRLESFSQRCPWPGCDFEAFPQNPFDLRGLKQHMRSAHGMPTMAEVLEAAEEVEAAG